MRRGWFGAAGLCLALACGGDSAGPSGYDGVPRVGRYSFSAAPVDSLAWDSYSGEMVVTFASADSVAGYWRVAGLDSAMGFGAWTVNDLGSGYLATADIVQPGGSLSLLFYRDFADDRHIICDGSIIYFAPGGQLVDPAMACQLTFLGR
jgi:hypothetical protein